MILTRRELLRLFGAGTVAGLITCGDNGRVRAASAVLDPDETSVVVAIWSQLADQPAEVAVRAGDQLVGVVPSVLDGEIGQLVVTGLVPDTRYEITVTVAGVA